MRCEYVDFLHVWVQLCSVKQSKSLTQDCTYTFFLIAGSALFVLRFGKAQCLLYHGLHYGVSRGNVLIDFSHEQLDEPFIVEQTQIFDQ